jgi:hypothetical protein
MRALLSFFAGSVTTVFIIWWTAVPHADVYSAGYDQGRKDALRMNPVSDDLEMTCAGLWFGKEGPIYYQIRKEYEKRTQPK